MYIIYIICQCMLYICVRDSYIYIYIKRAILLLRQCTIYLATRWSNIVGGIERILHQGTVRLNLFSIDIEQQSWKDLTTKFMPIMSKFIPVCSMYGVFEQFLRCILG